MSFTTYEDLFGNIDDIDGFSDDEDVDFINNSLSKKRKQNFQSYNNNDLNKNKKFRQDNWKSKNSNTTTNNDDNTMIKDLYSGIRVTKPLVSNDEFRELVRGRKMIKLSQIHKINKSNDNEDWVTIGVVLNKMTKTSKNGKEYSIWNLSDLSSEKLAISFFLFGLTHEKHWKLSIGSVIGLLNASFMDNNNNNNNNSGKKNINPPITIDDPDKLLHIGLSKDLGHCKAIKKNGEICGSLIMKADDEFCLYHIKNAFRKFSSKRAEIQSTFTDKEPEQYHFANNFQPNQTLNQNNIIVEMKKVNQSQFQNKKQQEQENLKKVMINPLSRSAKNLAAINSNDKKTNKMQTNEFDDKPIVCPKDVFMQIKNNNNNQQTKSIEMSSKNIPLLAKGYKPGQMIDLRITSLNEKQMNQNKIRAIEIFKKKQQQPAKNEKLERILKKVNASLEISNEEMKKEKEKNQLEKDKLIELAMQRKSINHNVLNVIENREMEKHFQMLEKREKYENRLAEITDIMVKVVTCRICKYTAPTQSDLCKSSHHQISHHQVKKRFFQCKHCKKRRFTYDSIYPIQQCQHCGHNSFERTSLINVKTETKLCDDKLLIRGEEIKFLK